MPSWKKLVTSGSDAAIPSVSPSGDFTIDAGGDIILDAAGTDIILKDSGTSFGKFKRDTSNFVIKAETADKDIVFKGVDGSTTIEAMRLDMSDGGNVVLGKNISGSASSTGSFGRVEATKFAGDGSELTNLPAGAVSAVNNATANELVTIGSTTTELDSETLLTWNGSVLGVGIASPSIVGGIHVKNPGSQNGVAVFESSDPYVSMTMKDSQGQGTIEYHGANDQFNISTAAGGVTPLIQISKTFVSASGASTGSFGTIQGPGVSIGKDNNAFFGKDAGLNADGDATRNVAVGEAAGKNLSGTATENVAVGYNALYHNTVGDSNSVVGTEAMYYINNEASDLNVAIGKQAGTFDKDGGQITNAIQSIAIGSSTKFNANGGTNEVVIGQGTIGQGDNTVTIGNANTTDVYLSHDSGSAVRGGAFVGTQKAHSSTGSKNVDLSTFANHNITITGNITLTPTNFSGRLGQSGIITLIQDSSGGHSITLNSLFKTPRGDSISFDTSADGISLMSYYVIDASNVAVNYLGPFS